MMDNIREDQSLYNRDFTIVSSKYDCVSDAVIEDHADISLLDKLSLSMPWLNRRNHVILSLNGVPD